MAARKWCAAACLVALLMGASIPAAQAKKRAKKAGDRVTKIERQQCEEGPCSEWDADLKPNCVLRCQSEQCYTTVYAADELEPGELDPVRANSFKACVRKEKTARLAAERDQKRARRGRTSR